jgi:hypothetical protein
MIYMHVNSKTWQLRFEEQDETPRGRQGSRASRGLVEAARWVEKEVLGGYLKHRFRPDLSAVALAKEEALAQEDLSAIA